jgi:hypothetical protein
MVRRTTRFPVVDLNHSVFMVKAASEDEARGKAMRVARKVYLAEDGWCDHSVAACPDGQVIDPDDDLTIAFGA